MKINDGQLDHANRCIGELQDYVRTLEGICARRLGLLKEVINCGVSYRTRAYQEMQIPSLLLDQIHAETDESEVGT